MLMVSGGSDSTALLELVCAYRDGEFAAQHDELAKMIERVLPHAHEMRLRVLHVNHLLRGDDSHADERFVQSRCRELNVDCEVQRVDIGAIALGSKKSMEVVAREERYRLARVALERMGRDVEHGLICTAHTLDDRIETFYMRSLVGTGPGGLASIPRARGNIRRPLLDATREQLRDWLRTRHPNQGDGELWREDTTNDEGVNFRSQVRRQLVPVLRQLRPGFEKPLAQTMDLIEEENEALDQEAQSFAYRNLDWDGTTARLPVRSLRALSVPMMKRVVRSCILVVNPDARLESSQIARICAHIEDTGYATETSGGVRVRVDEGALVMRKEQ